MVDVVEQGRSLAETPTYSVASVVTVLVFVCLFMQRALYKFGKWLQKTRRKALFASLEKIKEELMLLGLISLLLSQWAHYISEICIKSSYLNSKFYICSEEDYGTKENISLKSPFFFGNDTVIPPDGLLAHITHNCGEVKRLDIFKIFKCNRSMLILTDKMQGHEPFVSLEGLEQLHRFLFVLGITHVLYSCLAIALAMSKIYSWRKWESQTISLVTNLQALEVLGQQGPSVIGTQVKPRDELFWFNKPEILLRLIQFIIFQNSFEMATFIWSLWGLEERSCYLKNHYMIIIRLTSGVLVQFWCSYNTVPLNVIVTQMGTRCKKALVSERVRDSLHNWCKRVKDRRRGESVHSVATRSVCSLESTIYEGNETIASGTLSRSTSFETLNQITINSTNAEEILGTSNQNQGKLSFRVAEFLADSLNNVMSQPPDHDGDPENGYGEEEEEEEAKGETTLIELFQKNR
ncbi:hypothetical protein ACFE04_023349 [Oxalis oulophora]